MLEINEMISSNGELPKALDDVELCSERKYDALKVDRSAGVHRAAAAFELLCRMLRPTRPAEVHRQLLQHFVRHACCTYPFSPLSVDPASAFFVLSL